MWTARIIPLLCVTGVLVWLLRSGRSLDARMILDYTPSQPLLAALFLWLAFAVKSLSVIFPVMLIYAVSGQLFPLPVAFAVNLAGTFIVLSLPYLVGHTSELDFSDHLLEKYPKLQEIRSIRENNPFFIAFISRAVGVLPADVVSMYFGGTRLSYPAYLGGSMLGFMPDLICATLLGQQIEDRSSPAFWITVALNLLACLASILFYHWYRRKRGFA